MNYPIVNGPQHGTDLECEKEHEEGTIVHKSFVPRFTEYDDDTDTRFMHPMMDRIFLILGGKAYYLGEEIIGI